MARFDCHGQTNLRGRAAVFSLALGAIALGSCGPHATSDPEGQSPEHLSLTLASVSLPLEAPPSLFAHSPGSTPAVEFDISCGSRTWTVCFPALLGGGSRPQLSLPLGDCRAPSLDAVRTSYTPPDLEPTDVNIQVRHVKFADSTRALPGDNTLPEDSSYSDTAPLTCGSLPCQISTADAAAGDVGSAFEIVATGVGSPFTVVLTIFLDPSGSSVEPSTEPPVEPVSHEACTIACEGPSESTYSPPSGPLEVPVHIIWVDGLGERARRANLPPEVQPDPADALPEPLDAEARQALKAFLTPTGPETPGADTAFHFQRLLDTAVSTSDLTFRLASFQEIDVATIGAPEETWSSAQSCSGTDTGVFANLRLVSDSQTGDLLDYEPGGINVYVTDALLPLTANQPASPYTPPRPALAGFAFHPAQCCKAFPPAIMVSRTRATAAVRPERHNAIARLILHEIGHLAGLPHVVSASEEPSPQDSTEGVHRLDQRTYHTLDVAELGLDTTAPKAQHFPLLRNLMAGWDASLGMVTSAGQLDCLDTSARHEMGYLRWILALNSQNFADWRQTYTDFAGEACSACLVPTDGAGLQTDNGCDELIKYFIPNLNSLNTPWNSEPFTESYNYGFRWNPDAELALRSVAASKGSHSGTSTFAVDVFNNQIEMRAYALVMGGDNYDEWTSSPPASFPLSGPEEIFAIMAAELDNGNPPTAPPTPSWSWLQSLWDNVNPSNCSPSVYQPYTYDPGEGPLTDVTAFGGHTPITEDIWSCGPGTSGGPVRVNTDWYIIRLYGPHGQGL